MGRRNQILSGVPRDWNVKIGEVSVVAILALIAFRDEFERLLATKDDASILLNRQNRDCDDLWFRELNLLLNHGRTTHTYHPCLGCGVDDAARYTISVMTLAETSSHVGHVRILAQKLDMNIHR